MEKTITRQGPEIIGKDHKDKPIYKDPKQSYIWYSDGTKEPIEEYRKKHSKILDHTQKYNPEEQATRDRIMSRVMKYDKSTGMHYDPKKGFSRDENGKYTFSEEAARETLSGLTTGELIRLDKEMDRNLKGDKS